jgi:hypothetical protein
MAVAPVGPQGPPRIAAPDSYRSLRDARVPPMDYRDNFTPGSLLKAKPGSRLEAN